MPTSSGSAPQALATAARARGKIKRIIWAPFPWFLPDLEYGTELVMAWSSDRRGLRDRSHPTPLYQRSGGPKQPCGRLAGEGFWRHSTKSWPGDPSAPQGIRLAVSVLITAVVFLPPGSNGRLTRLALRLPGIGGLVRHLLFRRLLVQSSALFLVQFFQHQCGHGDTPVLFVEASRAGGTAAICRSRLTSSRSGPPVSMR